MTELRERVMARVDKVPRDENDGDCWIWRGGQSGCGQGKFSYRENGKQVSRLAHRLVYEFLVGPIPEGLELDHLCRVPLCCNPAHLEPVTPRENKRRVKTTPRYAGENPKRGISPCNSGVDVRRFRA